MAAVTVPYRVAQVGDREQHALFFKVGDDRAARLKAVLPLIFAGVLVHYALVVDDLYLFEIVALADKEVVGIVRRGDLDAAGAELGVDHVVLNDGDDASHERYDDLFAYEVAVLLVARVYRDSAVSEDRLWARRHDDDAAIFAVGELV